MTFLIMMFFLAGWILGYAHHLVKQELVQRSAKKYKYRCFRSKCHFKVSVDHQATLDQIVLTHARFHDMVDKP